MRVAKARLQPAGQRCVGQQRVQIHWHFGDADAMPLRGNRRMEIGERRAVIHPTAFGHEAVEKRQNAVGAVHEAAQQFVRAHARLLATLIEPCLGAGRFLGRWQPEEG